MGREHGEPSPGAPWWKGARGQWYVVAQIIIFGLIAVGPRSVRGLPVWTGPYTLVATVVGVALMVAGAVLCSARRAGASAPPSTQRDL